jgi:hypothetical protein
VRNIAYFVFETNFKILKSFLKSIISVTNWKYEMKEIYDSYPHQNVPKIMRYDNGGEFQNDEMDEFCHIHSLEVIYGRPYMPQD